MSITTQSFRFALTAAALCAAASTADAKPKRVVILDFDGPRQLADSGRGSVMSILGDQYEVVPTKRWEDARNTAAQRNHGPEQWARASRQSGVGAVIEGVVQDEGRRKILAITVREADNGKEFDTITVRMDPKAGLTTEGSRELQSKLDEVLYWIDSGRNDTPPAYQPISTGSTKRIGSTKSASDDVPEETVRPSGRRHAADADTTDDAPAPAPKHRRPRADAADTTDDAPVARPARTKVVVEADDTTEQAPAREAVPTTTAALDPSTPDVHDLSVLFPDRAKEQEELNPQVHHVPTASPRFMIDGGLYLGSRNLTFNGATDANLQQFSGVQTKGMAVNVAVYPFPTKAMDGGLSGFGFTGSLHHSISSTVDFDNTDQVDSYVLNQNGWEVGAHYRAPLNNLITLDGGAFYGNQTYEILDASQDFEIPNTKYSYLGASAHLDLNITDRATVGFGARYFTVLDTGDLASTDWFGPTSASGLGLEASFMIPLPKSLYVRGQLSYQRISLEMSGGGIITDAEGVTDGSDATITGNVNLGIAF